MGRRSVRTSDKIALLETIVFHVQFVSSLPIAFGMIRRKDGGLEESGRTFTTRMLSETGFWCAVLFFLLEFALIAKYFTHTTAMRRGAAASKTRRQSVRKWSLTQTGLSQDQLLYR